MFGIARMFLGATAWGVGASFGREIYERFKGYTPWAENLGRADLERRIAELEEELRNLQKKGAEAEPDLEV